MEGRVSGNGSNQQQIARSQGVDHDKSRRGSDARSCAVGGTRAAVMCQTRACRRRRRRYTAKRCAGVAETWTLWIPQGSSGVQAMRLCVDKRRHADSLVASGRASAGKGGGYGETPGPARHNHQGSRLRGSEQTGQTSAMSASAGKCHVRGARAHALPVFRRLDGRHASRGLGTLCWVLMHVSTDVDRGNPEGRLFHTLLLVLPSAVVVCTG